jgi:hypothetical protein
VKLLFDQLDAAQSRPPGGVIIPATLIKRVSVKDLRK